MAKPKPSSPEDIARKAAERRRAAFEAVNLPADIAELIQNAEIEVTRAGEERDRQKVKEDSARRLDAFSALKAGMQAGCYTAARRYEEQILIRRGEGDVGPSRERVDCTAGLTSDRMILAAEWIEGVNAKLPPRDWWLLMELISPTIERTSWRETVVYITGETHDHAQGSAVRSMAVNLRDAIAAHEKSQAEARRAA
jgi:hypothetical protein